mmetsp:Transcript_36548/g.117195  ORF Transcript_36548/g.117195 Transcript_36548/m.117195 type:complete len:276 (-) Transcript_36548:3-830(-)
MQSPPQGRKEGRKQKRGVIRTKEILLDELVAVVGFDGGEGVEALEEVDEGGEGLEDGVVAGGLAFVEGLEVGGPEGVGDGGFRRAGEPSGAADVEEVGEHRQVLGHDVGVPVLLGGVGHLRVFDEAEAEAVLVLGHRQAGVGVAPLVDDGVHLGREDGVRRVQGRPLPDESHQRRRLVQHRRRPRVVRHLEGRHLPKQELARLLHRLELVAAPEAMVLELDTRQRKRQADALRPPLDVEVVQRVLHRLLLKVDRPTTFLSGWISLSRSCPPQPHD